MIIKNDLELAYFDEYYLQSKYTMRFGVFNTGDLTFRAERTTNFYIAYVRDEWYASNNYGHSSSCKIPDAGIHLFSCAKNEYKECIPDVGIEISTHKLALSKDIHNFVLFLGGTNFRLIVADGSKSGCVLIMDAPASPSSCKTLAMAICAMIGQYNPTAAAEIESFWYSNSEDDQFTKKSKAIDWSNQQNNVQSDESTTVAPINWPTTFEPAKNYTPPKDRPVINGVNNSERDQAK